MKKEYKRENHKSYLVITDLEENEAEESYSLQMLCGNPVPGLLPLQIHEYNGEKELLFDISTKQPLTVLYEKREMRKEDLDVIFRSLKTITEQMEAYLLDEEYFVPDPELMYLDASGQKLYILYLPVGRREDDTKEMYAFAEYILDRICNEDERAVLYAYEFYRFIKEESGDLFAALARLFEEDAKAVLPGESGKGKEEWDIEKEGEEIESFYYEETEGMGETEESGEPERMHRQKIAWRVFLAVTALGGIGMIIYSSIRYALSWDTLFSQSESVAGAGITGAAIAGLILYRCMELAARKKKESETAADGSAAGKTPKKGVWGRLKQQDDAWQQDDVRRQGDIWKCDDARRQGGTWQQGDVWQQDDVLRQDDAWQQNDVLQQGDVWQQDDTRQQEAGAQWRDETQCAHKEYQGGTAAQTDYETVLLEENCYREQRILVGRIRGRKKQIDLSSFPFVIGKNKEQADYVLEDNSVSRMHARFTLREDAVYLTDLNSTNGTYKNGMRLEPNEMVMLEAEDEITIGRFDFVYH